MPYTKHTIRHTHVRTALGGRVVLLAVAGLRFGRRRCVAIVVRRGRRRLVIVVLRRMVAVAQAGAGGCMRGRRGIVAANVRVRIGGAARVRALRQVQFVGGLHQRMHSDDDGGCGWLWHRRRRLIAVTVIGGGVGGGGVCGGWVTVCYRAMMRGRGGGTGTAGVLAAIAGTGRRRAGFAVRAGRRAALAVAAGVVVRVGFVGLRMSVEFVW